MKNQLVASILGRWIGDIKELLDGILTDPFATGRKTRQGRNSGRSWERDLTGEISSQDKFYAAFLGVLSLIPAVLVLLTSSEPEWKRMALFFGAPLQVIIMGFLASILLFAGSYLNRIYKPYTLAFKLMLRLMSIYPFLCFLNLFHYGSVILLLVFGFFVIRGARKAYGIPVSNAFFFFGVIYTVFALMQLQTFAKPASISKFTPKSQVARARS